MSRFWELIQYFNGANSVPTEYTERVFTGSNNYWMFWREISGVSKGEGCSPLPPPAIKKNVENLFYTSVITKFQSYLNAKIIW